jgi:hypothetical protein
VVVTVWVTLVSFAAIVTLSLVASGVKVILLPAARVNESLCVSAVMVVLPTTIFLKLWWLLIKSRISECALVSALWFDIATSTISLIKSSVVSWGSCNIVPSCYIPNTSK